MYLYDKRFNHLLKNYEETYYPTRVGSAGRAAYVERNYEMIWRSSYCVVYFTVENLPKGRKSGTKIALEFAKKAKKNHYYVSRCLMQKFAGGYRSGQQCLRIIAPHCQKAA